MKRQYKQQTNDYKEMAVNKAKELGNASLVARQLGVSLGTLNNWITASRKAEEEGKSLSNSLSENDEIRRLKRELEDLKMENEIIKKAAAYFAQDQLPKNMPRSKK